ncbi:hypothetical protein GGI42DRAFT_176513 [Trichoderma sp. SZMC 28013]
MSQVSQGGREGEARPCYVDAVLVQCSRLAGNEKAGCLGLGRSKKRTCSHSDISLYLGMVGIACCFRAAKRCSTRAQLRAFTRTVGRLLKPSCCFRCVPNVVVGSSYYDVHINTFVFAHVAIWFFVLPSCQNGALVVPRFLKQICWVLHGSKFGTMKHMLVSKHTSSKRLITTKSFAWQAIETSCPGQRNCYYRYQMHAIFTTTYQTWGERTGFRASKWPPSPYYCSHGLPPKEVLFCPFFVFAFAGWTNSRPRTYRAPLI